MHGLPASLGAASRIIQARGLRDFANGFIAILLPAWLAALGLSATVIGLTATLALLGSAAVTLAIGHWGGAVAPRALLLGCAALMAASGAALAVVSAPWLILGVAMLGAINPSAASSSIFMPMEQVVLSQGAGTLRRTALLTRYSMVGALAAALGALAAASPQMLERLGWAQLDALRAMFILYALIGAAGWLTYRGLPEGAAVASRAAARLGPSRRIVHGLALLFSVDSFAGGLAAQSMMAVWLFERFELPLASAALFFFWSGVLGACSLPLAAWLAARIGLLNTMVFTHIPSSLCLIAAALMPDLRAALGLLLVRAVLSRMDVPARASFVMAVVTPAERTAAASFTSVPRSLAAAAGPVLAGLFFTAGHDAWPFVICGGLKIAYDIALFMLFRRVSPSEEH